MIANVEPVLGEYPSNKVNLTWRFYPTNAEVTGVKCYHNASLVYQYPEKPRYLKKNLLYMAEPGRFTLTITDVTDSDAGTYDCNFVPENSSHAIKLQHKQVLKSGIHQLSDRI